MSRTKVITIGERYGRLLVVAELPDRYYGNRVYECRCDCGNTTAVPSPSLRQGATRSCGCQSSRNTSRAATVTVGQQFGDLVVLAEGAKDPKRSERTYLCQCQCGATTTVPSGRLRSGNTKSCGCRRITHGHTRGTTHGTPTYRSWRSMKDRCLNPHSDAYPDYSGRGITVCERWATFENFLADMGERPEGLTLDRVDNEGNYEPSNCQWAD